MSIVRHTFIEELIRVPSVAMDDAPLCGEDIIFLSHQRWNTHVTAVHHSAVRLARRNRVLFMEPPDSIAWLLHEPAAREAMTWIAQPLERKGANLYVYHTPPLFLPGQARARWIARSVTATYEFMVRQAMHHLGMRRPIFWAYQFNTVWLVRALRSRLTVYECAEEWAANEPNPAIRPYIRRVDEEMCRSSDIVFVPSEYMFQEKWPFNPHTYRAPWGVDVALYSQARSPETAIPDDLADLPRPVVGIVGMFDGRRLHVELLRALATRHPDWSIVLVGRCMPNLDTRPLEAVPNIHLLGMRPVEMLPAYCKGFDVCMLPYHVEEFTRSILPLKLIEYLSTGKPVVTTSIPAAREFQDVYYVAATIDEFEQGVIAALAEDPARANERIRRGTEYDWDSLMHRRMEIVAERLAAKGSASATNAMRNAL